jgi:toxin FitB
MTIVADSNVIVAAAVKMHPFHARATPAVAAAVRSRELLMPQHVLIESFSVLTRGPEPLRHSPEAAYQSLNVSYGSCLIVGSSLRNVWQFIRDRNVATAGGAVYDALIAVTAIEAGARQLLTFNPKHFAAFAGQIEIVVPA